MRETYSHPTQLTQMYHQLDSYHVGTNRAVFFMLPRPHTVQSEFTFVNGPRELEGIQEFFLVVVRPKGSDFCVEAYLETAHINKHENRAPRERTSKPWEFPHVEARIEDPDTGLLEWDPDSFDLPVIKVSTFTPPPGYLIDVAVEPKPYQAFEIKAGKSGFKELSLDANHLTIEATATATFTDNTIGGNKIENASIDITFQVYLRSIEEEVKSGAETLFLTGRGLCCCKGKVSHGPTKVAAQDLMKAAENRMKESVTYETPLPVWKPFGKLQVAPTVTGATVAGAQQAAGEQPTYVREHMFPTPLDSNTTGGSMPIREANHRRIMIGETMRNSLNATDRYARGLVGLLETQFVAASFANAVRMSPQAANQHISELHGLDHQLARRMGEIAPGLQRLELLKMSLQEQRDRFQLTEDEVVQLRRAAITLRDSSGKPMDLSEPRLSPNILVPDLRGYSRKDAVELFRQNGLTLGRIAERETLEGCDQVVEQVPPPGMATLPYRVDLLVTTGPRVRIPDILGGKLTDSLLRLRDAGLKSEPILLGTSSRDNVVSSVVPAPGFKGIGSCEHQESDLGLRQRKTVQDVDGSGIKDAS